LRGIYSSYCQCLRSGLDPDPAIIQFKKVRKALISTVWYLESYGKKEQDPKPDPNPDSNPDP
jgi:hypothetical protein